MQLKTRLLALGAMCTLAILGAPNALATANEKTSTTTEKEKTVMVTVKAGDTLSSIAKEYKITYVKIYNANKTIANPDVIDVGDKLRIPTKDEKLPDRFSRYQTQIYTARTTAAPVSPQTQTMQRYTSAPVNSSSYYVGNGMWCTDYVASKRSDIRVYGNAGYNWLSAARAEGKSTGSKPKAGAVAVTNGHVAYVESVNKDGSYVVSEMGWNYKAGNYNKRTVSPGAFGGFIY